MLSEEPEQFFPNKTVYVLLSALTHKKMYLNMFNKASIILTALLITLFPDYTSCLLVIRGI